MSINPKQHPELAQAFYYKVPPLLDEPILLALCRKLRGGSAAHQDNASEGHFLFDKIVFCGHCSYALSGTLHGIKEHRYYSHPKKSGKVPIDCHHFSGVREDVIEAPIMKKLFDQFGDLPTRRKPVQRAKAGSEAEIKVAPAGLTPKRVRPDIEVLEEQVEHSRLGSAAHFKRMTFEDKTRLLRALFGGAERVPVKDKKRGQKQPKFAKHGIYITKTPNGNWKCEFKIKRFDPLSPVWVFDEPPSKVQDP